MKLSSVNNIKFHSQNYDDKNSVYKNGNYAMNTNVKNASNVNFTGLTSSLVKFWQWVENGGRALSFTIEDMGGTNIPRTLMGMFAGFQYTKKINMNALKQEGIREFLTGPTMTFMPIAILALLRTGCGRSVNTHNENLRNLSYLAKGTVKDGVMDQNKFIEKTVRDLLEKTTEKNIIENAQSTSDLTKEDVSRLKDILIKYKDTLIDKSIAKKDRKKLAASLLDEAQSTFSEIVKRTKSSFEGVDFLSAKYSITKDKQGSTNFKSYAEYIADYVNDFAKHTKNRLFNLSDDTLISNFKAGYMANRILTVACMVFITGKLMGYIPRLYTWASGAVNPNAKAIYNEAQKENKSGGVK